MIRYKESKKASNDSIKKKKMFVRLKENVQKGL